MRKCDQTEVTWHGHSNFQIRQAGLNIIIDPFFTCNPTANVTLDHVERPDLVLVTHLHDDHAGDAVELCIKHGSMLGVVVGASATLEQAGVPKKQILNHVGFNIGGTVCFGGAAITMVEAFHTSEAGAPVGYIITLPDGFTIYHAGDTGIYRNMKTWGQLYDINLALLPAGGVFTMDMRQAALAATFLRADRMIPMHWGTFPLLAQSMESLPGLVADMALLNPGGKNCECIVIEPGETVVF